MYTYIPISHPSCVFLPPSLSHPSRWSQSTKLISQCYAAASHQLSILHLVVYISPCHVHIFCGSGIWKWFIWVALAQGRSWWDQPRCSHLKAWLGLEALTPRFFSHVMQTVGRRHRPFQAAWMSSQYGFPHSRWSKREQGRCHMIYSLILGVTHGHFCNIFFN